MMYAHRPRRTREVTGPTPHSVAIIARPTNKRPPEHLILARRRDEEERQQAEERKRYQKQCDLKNDWERTTDRKIQQNTVRRKVQGYLQANEFTVEDRRQRLRELLQQEESQYMQEMEAKEETTIERQAKMRQRAKDLREKREKERTNFVMEKLDQKWRNECEELRGTLSKRQQDEVAAERMDQLQEKAELERIQQEQEEMYAKLWEEDRLAKAHREEMESMRQMERNRETLAILQQQMAALEAKKQEEKDLIREEAQLLKQEAELRKLEEQQMLEEKRRKQQECRRLFDENVALKNQKLAREEQEQLAFDMKMLEQVLEASRNEAKEQAQRKKELREEDKIYRDYLEQLRRQEARNEQELEQLLDAEVEKMWEKKLAQWRLEKQARRALLEDVLRGRRDQIQRKLALNETKRTEAQREREEILRRIEENKALEKEQLERLREQNMRHLADLKGQMAYNHQLRDIEQSEVEHEWGIQQEAEREYRRKLESALANPSLEKIHPLRRTNATMQQEQQHRRHGVLN